MASSDSDPNGRRHLALFTLDNETLMLILDQMTILERIRLERVCRRSRSVVAASLRRVYEVDFSEFTQKKIPNWSQWKGLYLFSEVLRRLRGQVRSLKVETPLSYDVFTNVLSVLIEHQPYNQLQKLYVDTITDMMMMMMRQGMNPSFVNQNPYRNAAILKNLLSDSSMKSLQVLHLGNVIDYTDSCVRSGLENCQNLVELGLRGCGRINDLKGLFPESLQTIYLRDMKLSRRYQLEELFGKRMPSLRSIVIRGNGINIGPDFAAMCPNLKKLDLSHGCLGDLEGIQNSQLTHLSLQASKGFDLLSEGRFLSMRMVDRASHGPCRLSETLKSLQLDYCHEFTPDSVYVLHQFVNLKELSLQGLSFADRDAALADTLFQGFPNLTTVNVRESRFVRDKTLETIALFCPKITYLDVRYCGQTDAGIQSMIEAVNGNPDRPESKELIIKVSQTRLPFERSGPIKIYDDLRFVPI